MEKVRFLNEKGRVINLPIKLANMPDYIRRHKLTRDSIEKLEAPKPIEQVNFEIKKGFSHEDFANSNEATQSIEEFEPTPLEIEEIKADSIELTKEDYFKILDEKGIEYKKTYGLAKLKELCQ